MAGINKFQIQFNAGEHVDSKCQTNPIKLKICLILIILLLPMLSSCDDPITNIGKIFVKDLPTPTPYLTPLPSQTYVYEEYVCGSVEGNSFLFAAELAYYPFNKKLRKQVMEAKRQDIPAILDEIRVVHTELVELEPPADCPILVELDYAMEAEVSSTITAFTAFYNGEKEEIWMGLLQTMVDYNDQVQSLMDQIYFREN